MATQEDKQTLTIKKILLVILIVGGVWMCIDSFCDYLGDHKILHLVQTIFFLMYIIFFGWQAVVDHKRNKGDK